MSERVIDVDSEIKSVSFDPEDVDQHIINLTLSCDSDDDVKTIAMLFHYKQLLERAQELESGKMIIEGDTEDQKIKNAYDRGRKDERAALTKNYVLKKK